MNKNVLEIGMGQGDYLIGVDLQMGEMLEQEVTAEEAVDDDDDLEFVRQLNSDGSFPKKIQVPMV